MTSWLKGNSFKLVKGTPWWKREYRGTIMPFKGYKFSLSLETLTGRPNIKRPSPTVTHRIVGTYSQEDYSPVVVLTFYGERLKLDDAIAIQEQFLLWWVTSLKRYKDLNVLTGSGRMGL